MLPFANLAAIRTFTRVNPHVYSQLTSLIEPCATLMTPVWLIFLVLGMGPHVVTNVTLKRLATNIAFVETLVFMKCKDVTL
jgi:hypothetical protein